MIVAARGRAALALAGGAAVLLASRSGQATPVSTLTLDLSPKPYAEALIEIGLRAKLSVLDVAACPGRAPALKGSFTPQQALALLLRDAPCRFEFLDAATVRLTPRRAVAAPQASRAVPKIRLATLPPTSDAKPAPPTSPGPATVDQIVVTAQKRPELLLRSAGSVSVIGRDRLEETSVVDTGDVIAQLADVSQTNLGPGRDKLLLRGVSDGAFTGRARSTVATYLDDAPITYNAPDPDLVLSDVDRVEIVRGPQGALYGGGSLGGVYRVVSRAPKLDAYGGSIQLRGSGTERGAASGGVEATVNAPLITDRLGVRATVYDIDDGGYLQDDTSRRSNVDRTVRTGGRVAFLADLAPDWAATLSGAVQRLTTADTQYTLGSTSLRRANLVRESHDNDFDEAGLVVTGKLAGLRLHSSTTYVRHDFTSLYDASAALSLFDAPQSDFGAYQETVNSEMLAQDIYVTTPPEQTLGWLAGAFASHLTEDTPSLLSARPSASGSGPALQTLYAETRRDHIDELALYGDLVWKATRRLTLTAGGRVFRTGVDVRADTLTPTQPIMERTTSGDDAHDGFSPKLSAQYEVSRRTSLYLLVSQGERAGGFNTGGLRAPSAAQREYAPDRLQNFEGGVKSQLWNGKADLQATLFYDRWRDIQTDQFFPSGLPLTANVGDGRLTGLETSAVLRPFSRLTLEANALLTTSRLTNVTPAFAQGIGKGLPGAPQVAAATYAVYHQPIRPGLDLLLSGRAAYTGRSRLSFDVTPVSTTSDTYVDAELSAQLVTRRYRLSLNLTNPADARANTFAYGNPFSFGQVRQSTPQRPRTLEVVASASF